MKPVGEFDMVFAFFCVINTCPNHMVFLASPIKNTISNKLFGGSVDSLFMTMRSVKHLGSQASSQRRMRD